MTLLAILSQSGTCANRHMQISFSFFEDLQTFTNLPILNVNRYVGSGGVALKRQVVALSLDTSTVLSVFDKAT